jgi:hypothetical protein
VPLQRGDWQLQNLQTPQKVGPVALKVSSHREHDPAMRSAAGGEALARWHVHAQPDGPYNLAPERLRLVSDALRSADQRVTNSSSERPVSP